MLFLVVGCANIATHLITGKTLCVHGVKMLKKHNPFSTIPVPIAN